MGTVDCLEPPRGGFSFDNCQRNAFLLKEGIVSHKMRKTGTTIVGIIFKDGVVLGADTRATCGDIVEDKYSEKIHYIAKNIYCCGAGTAADTTQVTNMISSQLELHRLQTGRQVLVETANRMIRQHLFRYQGYVGAALILGGVDIDGPHIKSVDPNGSSSSVPFATMGSGSLAAMAVFERKWKPNMELEDAKSLVCEAIKGGIFYDLGSGSNVDMCIITKDKTDYKKPYEVANLKGVRSENYRFKRGTTAILSSVTIPLIVDSVSVRRVLADGDAMDTSA